MSPPVEQFLSRVTVTMPVFNQLDYTRNCIASLNRAFIADEQIIVVNNASTDGTAEFLASRPNIRAVQNSANLGCGHAWTQGAQLSKTEWTIVMNNDVLVPLPCIGGMIRFAEEENFDIVSPAMCEGELDYDLESYAAEFICKMSGARRRDFAHGVCFMVHRRVFDAIGFFDSDPKLGGYEDDEYFRRARRAGFRLAMTGRALLHHFGSVTQKSIIGDQWNRSKGLGNREYYRRKTGQTWLKRKMETVRRTVRDHWWRRSELRRHGHTLREIHIGGQRLFR